jgi:hypothetical protein
MRKALLDLVTLRGGVLTRDEALAIVADHVLEDAVRGGCLVRLFPNVYALPALVGDRATRRRAALKYCPKAALSHMDALDLWGLDAQAWLTPAIHLTASDDHHVRRASGLVLHRRRGFVCDQPDVIVRAGSRVVRLETAIVDSWSLLPAIDRRVPAIVAVRERMTTGARLLAATEGRRLPAEVGRVFGLAASGCHSPLEMWGHDNVFSHPSLPPSRCQMPIHLPTGTVYLDRYYEEEKLAIELDGAAYHGSRGQRERDIRRDAELATRGIQTVRFSHPRLFGDPAGVRAEVREILVMRRRQFGLRSA